MKNIHRMALKQIKEIADRMHSEICKKSSECDNPHVYLEESKIEIEGIMKIKQWVDAIVE